MTLSEYLEAHGVTVAALALLVAKDPATIYRWLAWERREKHGENIDRRKCSQPGADEILAIQRITGGLVTLLNWQSKSESVPAIEPAA